MQSFTAITFATALFAGSGMAAPTLKRSTDTVSAPFNLTVNGGPYTNDGVAACHSGAAIEALCIGYGNSPFTLNATGESPASGYTPAGSLIFTLPSQPNPYPETLLYYSNSTSNVGAGYFGLSGPEAVVAFTASNQLVNVPAPGEQDSSWFVCPIDFEAYQYNVLSHVPSGETPTNTDCVAVTVTRSF